MNFWIIHFEPFTTASERLFYFSYPEISNNSLQFATILKFIFSLKASKINGIALKDKKYRKNINILLWELKVTLSLCNKSEKS